MSASDLSFDLPQPPKRKYTPKVSIEDQLYALLFLLRPYWNGDGGGLSKAFDDLEVFYGFRWPGHQPRELEQSSAIPITQQPEEAVWPVEFPYKVKLVRNDRPPPHWQFLFRTRWRGWAPEYDTWEPSSSFVEFVQDDKTKNNGFKTVLDILMIRFLIHWAVLGECENRLLSANIPFDMALLGQVVRHGSWAKQLSRELKQIDPRLAERFPEVACQGLGRFGVELYRPINTDVSFSFDDFVNLQSGTPRFLMAEVFSRIWFSRYYGTAGPPLLWWYQWINAVWPTLGHLSLTLGPEVSGRNFSDVRIPRLDRSPLPMPTCTDWMSHALAPVIQHQYDVVATVSYRQVFSQNPFRNRPENPPGTLRVANCGGQLSVIEQPYKLDSIWRPPWIDRPEHIQHGRWVAPWYSTLQSHVPDTILESHRTSRGLEDRIMFRPIYGRGRPDPCWVPRRFISRYFPYMIRDREGLLAAQRIKNLFWIRLNLVVPRVMTQNDLLSGRPNQKTTCFEIAKAWAATRSVFVKAASHVSEDSDIVGFDNAWDSVRISGKARDVIDAIFVFFTAFGNCGIQEHYSGQRRATDGHHCRLTIFLLLVQDYRDLYDDDEDQLLSMLLAAGFPQPLSGPNASVSFPSFDSQQRFPSSEQGDVVVDPSLRDAFLASAIKDTGGDRPILISEYPRTCAAILGTIVGDITEKATLKCWPQLKRYQDEWRTIRKFQTDFRAKLHGKAYFNLEGSINKSVDRLLVKISPKDYRQGVLLENTMWRRGEHLQTLLKGDVSWKQSAKSIESVVALHKRVIPLISVAFGAPTPIIPNPEVLWPAEVNQLGVLQRSKTQLEGQLPFYLGRGSDKIDFEVKHVMESSDDEAPSVAPAPNSVPF